MLTRRTFRQLTDFALFDSARPPPCLSAPRCRYSTRSLHPCRYNAGLARLDTNPSRTGQRRPASSSSSSTRWKSRQTRDAFSREAKVSGLKSRAAFKLLQIDQRYKLFKPGQTVVDLGYAPGSWSQVAVSKVRGEDGEKGGRVVGIDILPVQPPRGVSTIQGNLLSAAVRNEVRRYLGEDHGFKKPVVRQPEGEDEEADYEIITEDDATEHGDAQWSDDLDLSPEAPVSTAFVPTSAPEPPPPSPAPRKRSLKSSDVLNGRLVDLLLSDMMANTSGIPFKDHAASMDLCLAALTFAYENLKVGGGFVCKFFDGNESKEMEGRMKALFEKVIREKPESSRGESKEAFFICLRRKDGASREAVLGEKE